MSDAHSIPPDTTGAIQPKRSSVQEGQSLVELALLLPALVFIMVGVLDLGRAFHAYTTLVNASREGARYGAFHPTDSIGILNHVEQEATDSVIDLSQSTVIIETDAISPGTAIKVTGVYQFHAISTMIFSSHTVSFSGSASMMQF